MGCRIGTVQDVEGRGEVTAEAIACHRDLLIRWNHGRVGLEFFEPCFHVADLAEGKTEILDFERVRGFVVTGGVVQEFCGAEANDQIALF